MAFAPFSAAAAPTAKKAAPTAVSFPVTGTGPAVGLVDGVNFEGVLNITEFVRQGGSIRAIGTLTGTVTDTLGNVLGSVTDLAVNLPIFDITGTCDILHLELGPLDLDLLGLVVHLDQVVLDIDAEAGPGNLLGNLLCAVAHLLDGPGLHLGGLTNLLNDILDLLR